jgi:hypothetical protein
MVDHSQQTTMIWLLYFAKKRLFESSIFDVNNSKSISLDSKVTGSYGRANILAADF